MKKLVRESLYQNLNETFKLGTHEFKIIKIGDKTVYASKEGILGHHNIFIPWDIIEKVKNSL
jgi:hypothetical protein